MPDTFDTPAVVPPPSAEVSVRTMASDLAAVQASGGSSFSPTGIAQSVVHPVSAGSSSHIASSLLSWLAVIVAALALVAGGWFGYSYLTRMNAASEAPAADAPQATSTTPAEGLATLPATINAHTSQLTTPAPYTNTFPVIAPSGTLKTHFQLIREGLTQIPASVRVAELTPTNAQGKPLSFPGYASAISARDLIDAQAYSTYLQDDFTLLAVRGQGGFSAAYVLTLKPGSSWLYAAPGIREIENAPRLGSLFLQLSGSRATPFTDGTAGNQPIRMATYQEPAGMLAYGFFGTHLVIATSQQALDEVLLLL